MLEAISAPVLVIQVRSLQFFDGGVLMPEVAKYSPVSNFLYIYSLWKVFDPFGRNPTEPIPLPEFSAFSSSHPRFDNTPHSCRSYPSPRSDLFTYQPQTPSFSRATPVSCPTLVPHTSHSRIAPHTTFSVDRNPLPLPSRCGDHNHNGTHGQRRSDPT